MILINPLILNRHISPLISFRPEEGFVLSAIQGPHLMASSCAFYLQMPWSKAGRAGKLKCSPRSRGFVSLVHFSVNFGISIIPGHFCCSQERLIEIWRWCLVDSFTFHDQVFVLDTNPAFLDTALCQSLQLYQCRV